MSGLVNIVEMRACVTRFYLLSCSDFNAKITSSSSCFFLSIDLL